MLKIYTDTDTDFYPALAAEYGYKLISMPYSIDAKTVYPYVDFDSFDAHAFYDILRGGVLPTTSAISREQYLQYFEEDFKAGNEILYVHFSRAMTNTFDAMDQAVAQLRAQYPAARFEEIDTKGITTISYAIVREVGDLVKAGKTLDEILEWAKAEVDHFAMYFFADDLKFFRRSGRVSGLAATMGTLIGVRPLIHMSQEGKMVSVGTAKGRQKAIQYLVDKVGELGDEIEKHRICIGHTDAPEIARTIAGLIEERYGKQDIVYVDVNPTAGSHCGPNGVGVCFHAKNR
ncbi:MAG: DegV family protein [Bacteroidales bacterium]|nr:DegV family protein [Bacteroidales bacterium]MBR3989001.1 DegV family protein [Bacteroidales bacterium]